jgi:hypothetical protein
MPSDDNFADLEHKIERHDGELDQLLERIETLEGDLELILRLPGSIGSQIISSANMVGNPAFDQTVVQKCIDLVERYGLREE